MTRMTWMAVLGLAALAVLPAGAQTAGDPVAGKEVYQACTACHALDKNATGPMHRGVVGRKAGSVADFKYSPALRNADITWTPETLDQWLQDPGELVPGTKMYFSLADAKQRADVIAYLATQK